jgi:outer membrane protein assembly factor BamB
MSSFVLQKNRPDDELLRAVWIKSFDPVYDTGNLPIGLSAPLVVEGITFVGTPNGDFNAYDASSGRTLWSNNESSGFHSGATFADGAIIYGTVTGRAISRNWLTGKANYIVDLGSSVEAAPTIAKGRAFFHLRNHKIIAIDAVTGKILWGYSRTVPYQTTIQRASKPVVVDNKIFVGMADGYLLCLRLDDGALVWEKKLSTQTKFIDVDSTPVVKNGMIYTGSLAGTMNIVDANSGETVRQFEFSLAHAPIFIGEDLFVPTTSGEIVKLDSKWKETKRVSLSPRGNVSALASWKGRIVAGTTDGVIYLLDSSDLKILASRHLGSYASAVFSEIQNDELFMAVYSSRNRLYVFK